jgi:LETM1 and EF-hand domain-containing protein 1
LNITFSYSLTSLKLNEAELEVDSEKASYKQKLEVLQQQQELIDDEAEQEQKEEDARRAKREAAELEAQVAQSLLPDSEVLFPSSCEISSVNTQTAHA